MDLNCAYPPSPPHPRIHKNCASDSDNHHTTHQATEKEDYANPGQNSSPQEERSRPFQRNLANVDCSSVLMSDRAPKESQDLASQPWYYGLLSGDDLTDHLREVGDFLVRCWDSGNGMQLFLSYKHDKTPTTPTSASDATPGSEGEPKDAEAVSGIRHFPVQHQKDWFIPTSKARGFHTVANLIKYYQSNPLPDGGVLIRGSLRPRWLLKHCQIKFNKQKDLLGSGNFCDVYKAIFDNRIEVACKECHILADMVKLKLTSELKDLLEEGKLLSKIKHDNVIDFIGLCCDALPVFVLMELCALVLLKHLENKNINISAGERIHYSKEIAQGMTYLQEKNYIHRDLAARNILFSRNGVCKIADFGLTKIVQELQRKTPTTKANLPIRWMAPETLVADPKYSTKCDVWAFGVLLYEIFTHGEKIYPDWEVKKVAHYIRKGPMPKPPSGMPKLMAEIMDKCWTMKPEDRPDFCDMLKDIDAALLIDPPPDISDFTLSAVDGIIMLTEDEKACLNLKLKSKMLDIVAVPSEPKKKKPVKTKTVVVDALQVVIPDAVVHVPGKLVFMPTKATATNLEEDFQPEAVVNEFDPVKKAADTEMAPLKMDNDRKVSMRGSVRRKVVQRPERGTVEIGKSSGVKKKNRQKTREQAEESPHSSSRNSNRRSASKGTEGKSTARRKTSSIQKKRKATK